ncbi:MAG TPA: hypothetical protein VGA36_12175 [Nitriliruptorales bacterium]
MPPGPAAAALPDLPAAPDGSQRRPGRLRSPGFRAVRGPYAGVPDVSDFGLARVFGDPRPGGPGPAAPLPSDLVDFQHASERRFARLLDAHGVAWEYEPDSYPIEWDDEGQPTRFFQPDFYLPAFDTYIEITTSAQRLVTKKNRKLRLLREHHPTVRCKLFYQHDYRELVRRFGLDDAADEEE